MATSARSAAAAWASAGVLLAVLALFASGAALRDAWRTDEHRYLEVARSLGDQGSWLVPRVNGDVYDDKPPGFFWLTALAHRALGLELARAGMTPSVLAAAACVAVAFALARRLAGPAEAWATAIVLASSELFLSLALRANLDALLTLATTAAVACYAAAELGEGSARARRAWLTAGALSLAGGLIVKGFVALLVPACAVLGQRLTMRSARPPRLSSGALALTALAALALASLWLLAATLEAGPHYARSLVLGHGVGHALGVVDKVEAPWYYLRAFPGGFLPWILLFPAALAHAVRGRRDPAVRLALAWWLGPFVVLSLIPAKRHLYMAPLHPAAALLVGVLLGERLRGAALPPGLVPRLWRLGHGGLGIAGVATGLLMLAAAWSPPDWRGWGEPWTGLLAAAPLSCGLAPVLGAPLVAGGLGALVLGDARARARAIGAVGLAVSASLAWVFHPIEALGHDHRAFYAEVARRAGEDPVVSYGGLDYAPNWLLRRREVPDLRTPEALQTWLRGHPGPVFVIAEAPKVERLGLPLPSEVLVRGERPLDDTLLLLRPAAHRPDPAAPPRG